MTRPTVEVLRLLLAAPPHEPLWAAGIAEQTGLGKSTVSQILTRLAKRQWIASRQERGPHPGRPPRALGVLTRQGRREAEAALAARGGNRHHGSEESVPADATVAGQNPAHAGGRTLRLHHPISFSALTSRLRAPAAEPRSDDVPEAVAVERLAALKEVGAISRFGDSGVRDSRVWVCCCWSGAVSGVGALSWW